MSDIAWKQDDIPAPAAESKDRVRRSTVAFPYVSLDEAVVATGVIHEKAGRECDLAQLAAWLDTKVTSSKFRSTVSAVRMFGLIDRHAKTISLTERGEAIIDPEQREQAAVDAFLCVPLYRDVFDLYSGKLLPGDAGLEKELEKLGVTQKSAAKARQVLQRSASHAGFFHSGRDRLVRPAGASAQRQAVDSHGDSSPSHAEEDAVAPAQPEAPTGPTDPLLRGLWSKLPSEGAYSAAEQEQWLEMAKLALQMVYGSDDVATPTVPATTAPPETSTGNEDAQAVFAEPKSA